MVLELIIGIAITLPIIFLVLCYRVFAPRNLFFTFGRENRAVYVMVGKRFTGKIILPSKTIYIDEKDNYLIKKFENLSLGEIKKIKKRNLFGMYWIGIPPLYSIYERRQQWLEWKSIDGGSRTIKLRDEMTPYLFCKPFEYAMFIEEAEDSNGVPLNVYFTVTLMPTSATLPIFGNDNAYGQVQTKCISEVLLFTKTKTFADLGKGNPKSNITNDEFSLILRSLNDQIPGSPIGHGIKNILGYEITDAKLDKVEIGGKNKDALLNASTVVYIEDEARKAKILKAQGEQASEVLIAEGKKQGIILIAEGNKIAGKLGIDVEKYDMKIRNQFYELIKDKPFAQQIELARKMFTDSNLTTFVSGKDATPTINIGGQ